MEIFLFASVLNPRTIAAIKAGGFRVGEERLCPNGTDHGLERRVTVLDQDLELLERIIKQNLPKKQRGLPLWGENS